MNFCKILAIIDRGNSRLELNFPKKIFLKLPKSLIFFWKIKTEILFHEKITLKYISIFT